LAEISRQLFGPVLRYNEVFLYSVGSTAHSPTFAVGSRSHYPFIVFMRRKQRQMLTTNDENQSLTDTSKPQKIQYFKRLPS